MLEIRNIDVHLWSLLRPGQTDSNKILFMADRPTYLHIAAQLEQAVARFPQVSVLLRCRPPSEATQTMLRNNLARSSWSDRRYHWYRTLKLRCNRDSSGLEVSPDEVVLELSDRGVDCFLNNCRVQADPTTNYGTGMQDVLGYPSEVAFQFSPDFSGVE